MDKKMAEGNNGVDLMSENRKRDLKKGVEPSSQVHGPDTVETMENGVRFIVKSIRSFRRRGRKVGPANQYERSSRLENIPLRMQ